MKKSIALIIFVISLLSILSIGAVAHGDAYYTIEYDVNIEDDHDWVLYPLNFFYDASDWLWTKSDAQTIIDVPEHNGTGWARVVVTSADGTVRSHDTNEKFDNMISSNKIETTTKFASCVVFTGNKEIDGHSVAHQQIHYY